jgi:signal transduction histidine kinase
MSKTGLQGPYPLSFDAIDTVVRSTSAGVYALGHTDAQGRFAINHVGRSDSDLRAKLLDCMGIEMALVALGVGRLVLEPLPDGFPAPLQ